MGYEVGGITVVFSEWIIRRNAAGIRFVSVFPKSRNVLEPSFLHEPIS